MMRINGFIPISKLNGKCATCKNFNQLIKELYGIKTLTARGNCNITKKYKARTESCVKWEENKNV